MDKNLDRLQRLNNIGKSEMRFRNMKREVSKNIYEQRKNNTFSAHSDPLFTEIVDFPSVDPEPSNLSVASLQGRLLERNPVSEVFFSKYPEYKVYKKNNVVNAGSDKTQFQNCEMVKQEVVKQPPAKKAKILGTPEQLIREFIINCATKISSLASEDVFLNDSFFDFLKTQAEEIVNGLALDKDIVKEFSTYKGIKKYYSYQKTDEVAALGKKPHVKFFQNSQGLPLNKGACAFRSGLVVVDSSMAVSTMVRLYKMIFFKDMIMEKIAASYKKGLDQEKFIQFIQQGFDFNDIIRAYKELLSSMDTIKEYVKMTQ